MQVDYDWWLSLFIGGCLVVLYSVPRFNVPSYDNHAGYYKKYAPKFTTSPRDFNRARFWYLVVVLALYVLFSVAMVPADLKDYRSIANPLAIALLIVSIDKIAQVKYAEEFIRGIIHTFGLIPQAIRVILDKLNGPDFKFDMAKCERHIKRIAAKRADDTYDVSMELIYEDDILRNWLKISCILSDISDDNQANTGISGDFFAGFGEELKNIRLEFECITKGVRQHLADLPTRNKNPDRQNECEAEDNKLLAELRELRLRLFTFVACGVRSSAATDVQCAEILRNMGFSGNIRFSCNHKVGTLLASLVVVLMLVVLTLVISTHLMTIYDIAVVRALEIPEKDSQVISWFLCSALVYLISIFIPLSIRVTDINNHQWFDLGNLDRRRPWPNYLMPAVLGFAVGSLVLFLIAAFGGPGFKPCNIAASGVMNCIKEGFDKSFYWFSLPLVLAFAGLWVSDSVDMGDETNTPLYKFFIRSLCFAGLMAVVAAIIMVTKSPPAIAALGAVNKVIAITFIPLHVLFLSGVMLFTIQLYIYLNDDSRRLAGKCLRAKPARAPEFALLLDSAGHASSFAANEKDFKPASARRHGRWVRFPEGAVVQWDSDAKSDETADEIGLIVWSSGVPVYESFKERISENPKYVAELYMRSLPVNGGMGYASR